MLTRLEIKVLYLLYSALGSHIFLMPLFDWDNLKLIVRLNGRLVSHWTLNCVIVLELVYSIKQFPMLIKDRDIHTAILQFIYILRLYSHFVLRLNMLLYKTEVARLISQTLHINKEWGNKILQIFRCLKS